MHTSDSCFSRAHCVLRQGNTESLRESGSEHRVNDDIIPPSMPPNAHARDPRERIPQHTLQLLHNGS